MRLLALLFACSLPLCAADGWSPAARTAANAHFRSSFQSWVATYLLADALTKKVYSPEEVRAMATGLVASVEEAGAELRELAAARDQLPPGGGELLVRLAEADDVLIRQQRALLDYIETKAAAAAARYAAHQVDGAKKLETVRKELARLALDTRPEPALPAFERARRGHLQALAEHEAEVDAALEQLRKETDRQMQGK